MIEPKKIHFVGIGGVGMGTLATALSNMGCEISGSDGTLYEPMKGVLERAGIAIKEGYDANSVQQFDPDLVIIGNVIRSSNAEARAWINSPKPFLSFPEAIRKFAIDSRASIVCAGTHGKTTTATWTAYLLDKLGLSPSYFIGGVPVDLDQGCVIREGGYFVGEGDEYDSAFFDKGPKFLHYDPKYLILSSIEFDHADIYRDLDHVKAAFQKLIAIMPGDGLCLARFEDANIKEVCRTALCQVQTFGTSLGALWQLRSWNHVDGFVEFDVFYKRRTLGMFRSRIFGAHNLLNMVSGIAVAINLGAKLDDVKAAVETFQGVRRRQQFLMTDPIVLIDDFAHHPTEVQATLSSVRERYKESNIVACFEPRSTTSRRKHHQEAYAEAFGSADSVLVMAPYQAAGENAEEVFSTKQLVQDIEGKGKKAADFETVDDMVTHLSSSLKPNDIVVVMSNGEFGKIQSKIMALYS